MSSYDYAAGLIERASEALVSVSAIFPAEQIAQNEDVAATYVAAVLDAKAAWDNEQMDPAQRVRSGLLQNLHEAIDPVLEEIAQEIDGAIPTLIAERDRERERAEQYRRELKALRQPEEENTAQPRTP